MVKKRKKARAARGNAHDLVSRPKSYKLKPHHAKPYRKRHIGLLIIALAFSLFIVFRLGIIIGGSNEKVTDPQSATVAPPSNLQTVSSAYGFNIDFDPSLFTSTATAVDDSGVAQSVSRSKLDSNLQINFIALKPKSNAVRAALIASQLSIQVQPDSTGFVALKADPASAGKTDAELATQLQPVTSSADFDVSQVSQANDTLGDGTAIVKTTYQYTPKFDGGISYAVVWTGVVKDHPFVIKLSGLVNDSTVPQEYEDMLSSIRIRGGPKVQGLSLRMSETAFAESSSGLDSKFLADSLSPAVVKIYHVICGDLVVSGTVTGHGCDGATGSGFFVSSDGYVATNGHVAVVTPKDLFVKAVTSDAKIFATFLQGGGYTNEEVTDIINDSQKVAAIIVKIYDLDDSTFQLKNEKELTLVALGKEPLKVASTDTMQTLVDMQETDSLKHAKVVGYDYSAKSDWARDAGSADDTSTSDVALLKVNVSNTPFIRPFSGTITQNEKIVVLGFPGDAENALVNNDLLDVSVTNGSISAIKESAGDKGKLYQSDADASHGNSGGPAVTAAGEAFGLLTYRVSGDNEGNAAKSYIRDITDLTKLAQSKNVTFATTSSTQDAWTKGLTLFSQNHFSAAKKEFQTVQQSYPAHRLVGGYIDNADKQIAAGNDVKLYPPILIGSVVAGGIVLIGVAIVLIVRHRARHQTYISQHPGGTTGGGAQVGGSPLPPAPQGGQYAPLQSAVPASPASPVSSVSSAVVPPISSPAAEQRQAISPLISSVTPPSTTGTSVSVPTTPVVNSVAAGPTVATPAEAQPRIEGTEEVPPTIITPTPGV